MWVAGSGSLSSGSISDSADEYNKKICTGVMSTDYEIIEENYIPILEEQVWTIFGKMWTGTEWLPNPNQPVYPDPPMV